MTAEYPTALLKGNDDHVASLPPDYFADVQDGQEPVVVSVCCSDSRVSQERMFDVTEPGRLFTPSNIGNQVWDRIEVDGETKTVVDGNLLYPVTHTGTRVIAVVGHTQCGAVTAAYERASATDSDSEPAGIRALVDMLVPVVEDAIDAGVVDTTDPDAKVIDALVEYNVDRQVGFLRDSDEIPADASVYGFVYDFHGTYGGPAGTLYLVNAEGDRDVDSLRTGVDDAVRAHVARLTDY